MKQDIRFKGQLRLYMQWPAIMAIFLLAMNVWIFTIDKKAGLVMSLFVVIYLVAVGILYFHNKSVVLNDLVDFASQYGFMQNEILQEFPVPYAILKTDGKILWMNRCGIDLFEDEDIVGKYLSNYIHDLNRSIFPRSEEDERVEAEVDYKGREYIAKLSKVYIPESSDTVNAFHLPGGETYFVAVSLDDVTDLNKYVRENEEQKLVAGLIYIDNYEEVMESVEEVRQSLLVALIDRKVNQYMAACDGIVKKMEKDKYFFVIKKKYFHEMEKNKFSILEEAKGVNIGNTMPVTLSIGIGMQDTYVQSYAHARVAIDLALARGGDQAVVKNGKNISYYGGKREQTAKNTRVKARVKAEALREFIMTKEQVIVMGHRIADVDSFGAAVGIYRAARTMEKKVHIVLDEITTSVRILYDQFQESPAYPEDMFIRSSEIHEYMSDNTMVVVVDTNKPDITECPELLKRAKTIVVFDHHRQSGHGIENTVLSYIEPYASSACEMVAEVLQYIADDIKISSIEANSMYAGIMIDTNNFMNRTGVRTFEAAAFLRRCGADVTQVRKMFRDDLESYRVKAEIVSSAEVFRDVYAIAVSKNHNIESPTIIGAQAANDLLNINGIRASFVLTEYGGKIYVSARAIDEVNVQIIMERLGGGGHINTAGAQFQHTDMSAAITTLKQVIGTMIAEGDI